MGALTGDYRKFMDKNFLGSWDLPDGEDLILTIKEVSRDKVKNERGTEEKLTIHFVEDYKPMILNSTNCDRITQAYGSPKVEDWPGKKVALCTEKVAAFGGIKDAVRIRPYAPKTETYTCADCGQEIKQYGKYAAKVIAERAKTKYGVYLCWDCAQIRKEAEE